jgi:hypothetical protein
MLVHSDGVDFRLLKPTWFAIGLFVLLPALFGGAIGPVVERVREPTSRTAVGRVRWILPIVLVLAFPLTIPIVVISAFVFTAWVLLADAAGTRPLVSDRGAGLGGADR